MSQGHLGKHLGVTFQQIQKYEKAANRGQCGAAITIATVLKVPVVAFYGPIKGTPTDSLPLEFLTKRDAFKLAEAFDKITSSASATLSSRSCKP